MKIAVLRSHEDGETETLALRTDRIRRRDLARVIEDAYPVALKEAGVDANDVAYVASTGEGELVTFRGAGTIGDNRNITFREDDVDMIRLDLAVVGLASLGLLACVATIGPRPPIWLHFLAFFGCLAFCFQTAILDALVWTAFFPV